MFLGICMKGLLRGRTLWGLPERLQRWECQHQTEKVRSGEVERFSVSFVTRFTKGKQLSNVSKRLMSKLLVESMRGRRLNASFLVNKKDTTHFRLGQFLPFCP